MKLKALILIFLFVFPSLGNAQETSLEEGERLYDFENEEVLGALTPPKYPFFGCTYYLKKPHLFDASFRKDFTKEILQSVYEM